MARARPPWQTAPHVCGSAPSRLPPSATWPGVVRGLGARCGAASARGRGTRSARPRPPLLPSPTPSPPRGAARPRPWRGGTAWPPARALPPPRRGHGARPWFPRRGSWPGTRLGARPPTPVPARRGAPTQRGPSPARLRLARPRCPYVAWRVRGSALACAWLVRGASARPCVRVLEWCA
jgi:hypothetical protein